MGANLDDANMYYKEQWAKEMTELFGTEKPDFDELIDPQTDEARERARLLKEKHKMDARFMKEVDERFGPLEWRLPEAHSIYWAALGLKKAEEHPEKMTKFDVTQLRRGIYASMQVSFRRGRLVRNSNVFDFRPNLDIFPRVVAAYEAMIAEEPDQSQKDVFRRAQRNEIRTAVYYFYVNNRLADAAKWYRVLSERFPNDPLIIDDPNSLPRNLTLTEYAVARIQEEVNDTSPDGIKAVIEGLLFSAYQELILGEEDRYVGLRLIAQNVWENYQRKISDRKEAIGLPSLDALSRDILKRMLDPETGLADEYRAILRTKLGLKDEAVAPSSTNAPGASANSLSTVRR
jgi:hypothetical protein